MKGPPAVGIVMFIDQHEMKVPPAVAVLESTQPKRTKGTTASHTITVTVCIDNGILVVFKWCASSSTTPTRYVNRSCVQHPPLCRLPSICMSRVRGVCLTIAAVGQVNHTSPFAGQASRRAREGGAGEGRITPIAASLGGRHRRRLLPRR